MSKTGKPGNCLITSPYPPVNAIHETFIEVAGKQTVSITTSIAYTCSTIDKNG